MSAYLKELFGHQHWADAEHWRAFEAHPPALVDKALFERLHHIHLVQHAFLWISGPRTPQFEYRKLEEFPDATTLKHMRGRGFRIWMNG